MQFDKFDEVKNSKHKLLLGPHSPSSILVCVCYRIIPYLKSFGIRHILFIYLFQPLSMGKKAYNIYFREKIEIEAAREK